MIFVTSLTGIRLRYPLFARKISLTTSIAALVKGVGIDRIGNPLVVWAVFPSGKMTIDDRQAGLGLQTFMSIC